MNKITTTLLTIPVMVAAAHAATTLISPTTLNGGFESGTVAYTTGTNWFNYGANTEGTSVYSTTHYAGTYGATVSFASNPSIATGWTITAGDSYNLSFYAYGTDTTKFAATPIKWSLYYYPTEGGGGFDKTSDTSGVELFGASSTISAANTWTSNTTGDLSTLSLDVGSVAAASGKTLYLKLYRTAGDGTFPLIDNVTLTASAAAVPEPATYGLLGAGALAGLAFVRRRKRA